MPAPRSNRDAKPILDAVNDAVSALTDVVRSLRASAAKSSSRARSTVSTVSSRVARAKADVKAGARVAKSSMKKGARAVRQTARDARHGIKERLEHAWDVLTREPTATNGHAGLSSRKRA